MKPIHTFIATPRLPSSLNPLRELAYNLRWAWDHDTIELFRRLDSSLWETTGHNPLLMLGTIDQAKLEDAASDDGLLAHLKRVTDDLRAYMAAESTWFGRAHGGAPGPLVAYFSAEFGVTECLSIFAGGLGVLAGDHLKSASDLGVPLLGVGLLYQEGYFRQHLNRSGWQEEAYENNDFYNLPLALERDHAGMSLSVAVPYPGRTVTAQVWRAQVGRVPLYLLDTNIPANRPEDRIITDQLYRADPDTRIRQEIMLGIGGCRALEALGVEPVVYHMNEGHSAFLCLERVRRTMEKHGLSFAEARQVISAGLVFTTHTSVPAGHDYFAPDLVLRYLGNYADALGLTNPEFLALGRQNAHNDGEHFCPTVLALRLAAHSNGVSRLHGQVSRQMWQGLYPNVPVEEVPIAHVTNGVHFQSWISREMKELYDRYLGPRWREEVADHTVWQRAERIAAEELWRTHERRRERMVAFARNRLRTQLLGRGASPSEIEMADEVLDPDALTIGFARRFATYKRATLLLRDPDRLARILNHPDRPVQVIFAGKAHPDDEPGKQLIRQIVELSRQAPFRRRLVLLEDYDMAVARYLVQGSDVWLNTPLRPLEASGTSGIKATANAVLNVSILDGWWDEAYRPEVGWAIGYGRTYDDRGYQDRLEAEALYELLEQEVAPAFYDRGQDGLPRRWIARMKASMQNLCYLFNTNRMVGEYTERFYLPAVAQSRLLTADGLSRAKALAAWESVIRAKWPQVQVKAVETQNLSEVQVGDAYSVSALIGLGDLTTDDVAAELCLGQVDSHGNIVQVEAVPMVLREPCGEGIYRYEARGIVCRHSGMHGCTVRVRPHHPNLYTRVIAGLMAWA